MILMSGWHKELSNVDFVTAFLIRIDTEKRVIESFYSRTRDAENLRKLSVFHRFIIWIYPMSFFRLF